MSEDRRYEAEVVDSALGYAKSGTEQVAIKFRTEAGIFVKYGSLSDRAQQYTTKDLVTCGWDGDWTNLASMHGNKVQILVGDEEYNGKTTTKVKFINELRDMLANTMTPDQVKAFAAKMGQGSVPASSGGFDGGGFAAVDDDMPFALNVSCEPHERWRR